jgi:hypothetical protein
MNMEKKKYIRYVRSTVYPLKISMQLHAYDALKQSLQEVFWCFENHRASSRALFGVTLGLDRLQGIECVLLPCVVEILREVMKLFDGVQIEFPCKRVQLAVARDINEVFQEIETSLGKVEVVSSL